jgi:hypothetical protein
MSTAPSVPASPSRLLEHVAIGELSTALAVHTSYGPAGLVTGTFNVNFGRRGASFREWSSVEFPFTAEGERAAQAKFNALVSAALLVQS